MTVYLAGLCCPECEQQQDSGLLAGAVDSGLLAGVIDPVGWGTLESQGLGRYLGFSINPFDYGYALPTDAQSALSDPAVGDPAGFFGSSGAFNNAVNPGIMQLPGAMSSIAAGIPVVGPVMMGLELFGSFRNAKQVLNNLLAQFGIGLGRREADVITPIQNSLAARLSVIDARVGHDAMGTSDLGLLYIMLKELHDIRTHWLTFLDDKRTFTDGRASQQAANDIMPLIDGTGNYVWPAMSGTPVTQDRWGNPTNGGRIGAVQRRIVQLGGNPYVANPPLVLSSTTVLVGLGIAAILMLRGKHGGV